MKLDSDLSGADLSHPASISLTEIAITTPTAFPALLRQLHATVIRSRMERDEFFESGRCVGPADKCRPYNDCVHDVQALLTESLGVDRGTSYARWYEKALLTTAASPCAFFAGMNDLNAPRLALIDARTCTMPQKWHRLAEQVLQMAIEEWAGEGP